LQPIEDAAPPNDAGMNSSVTAAAKSSPATDQTGPIAEPDCHKGSDSQRGVEIGSGIGDTIVQVNQEVNISHVAVQQTEYVRHGEHNTKQLENAIRIHFDEKSHLVLPNKQVLPASSDRKWQGHSGTPYLQYAGRHAADASSKDTGAEPDCHQAQGSQRLIMDWAVNNNNLEVQRGVHVPEKLVDTECINVDKGNHLMRVFPASSTRKWENYHASPYPQHTASPTTGASFKENSQEFPNTMNPQASHYLQHQTASGDGEPVLETAEVDHKSFSHAVNSQGCYEIMSRSLDITIFSVITAFTLCIVLIVLYLY